MDAELAENLKAGLMSIDNQPLHKGFAGPASQACSELERANETQTQETTQMSEFPTEQVRHKRGSDLLTEHDNPTRRTKKLKISVAVGIDLAE
jgi:meiosis-specific protein HOP1